MPAGPTSKGLGFMSKISPKPFNKVYIEAGRGHKKITDEQKRIRRRVGLTSQVPEIEVPKVTLNPPRPLRIERDKRSFRRRGYRSSMITSNLQPAQTQKAKALGI